MTLWRYRPQLDGARAAAVLAVIAFHSHPGIAPGGYLGVQLFFVLSGYLITGLLAAEVERTGGISLKAFYARRMLRLYPALLLAVTLALGLAWLVGRQNPLDASLWWRAVASLLYVSDFTGTATDGGGAWLGPTWSLSVEEQFYLAWPFVLLLALRRGRDRSVGRYCLAAAAVFALLTAGSRALLGHGVTYFTPVGSVAALLAGAGIALIGVRASRSLSIAASAAVVVLAGLLLVAPNINYAVTFYGPHQLAVAACAVVVAYLVTSPGPALLSHPVAVWIGRRSYGLYLFHEIVRVGLHNVMPDWRPAFITAAGVPLAFALAALSYRFVEAPFLRRKKRYARVPGEAAVEQKTADAA